MEVYDPFPMFSTAAIKPEPIPLDAKVVVLGNPLVYHLLYLHDEDFREIFKVKSRLLVRDGAGRRSRPKCAASFVRKLTCHEGCLPFDAAAVAEIGP